MANDKKVERLSIRKILDTAQNEINDELVKGFVTQVKVKMRSLAQAKEIVKNIEREIQDMEIAIDEKLA